MTTIDDIQPQDIDQNTENTNPIPLRIEVRSVDSNSPMRWLKKGVDDFKVSPLLSLAYGGFYALLGVILIAITYNKPMYALALVTVFYLLGPIIAVGLYCMSRHIEAGVKPAFGQGCKALCYNPVGVVSFAIIIGMLVVFWTIIAATIIALLFSNINIHGSIYDTIMANTQLLPFVGILFAIGLIFALVSFSMSVISIPLMTHKKVDVVTAITTSIRAVKRNPGVMFSWAAMIVTIMAIGFAFAFIGIAVALPIIGHASWHAYRELVVSEDPVTADECDIEAFPFFKGKI